MVMAMPPMTTRDVEVPTCDRMTSAIRRSRPVTDIAAARNSAAATRISAVLPKPLTAIVRPCVVPSRAAGFAGSGEMPSSTAISPAITMALTA